MYPNTGHAERRCNVDIDAERARLLQRDHEWAGAAAEGRDVEHILSFWTDDAVVLPPGLPAFVGKAAARHYVEDNLAIPGFKITWTSTDVNFSADRELAYIFSQEAATINAPNGTPTPIENRAVTIWRRDPDVECAVLWISGMQNLRPNSVI
jgi:ketosteroid isomerase-like protein